MRIIWSKEAGPRPTKGQLEAAQTVARPGSKTCIAVAMALRPQGTTQSQVKKVLGGPYRNKLRDLVDSGKVVSVKMKDNEGLKVYRITLKRRKAA